MQYHNNILSIIGNTPLVKINFKSRAQIYAKLEYLNPGGSIKDRSALAMIEDAERQGLLRPKGTIIEASSGNQGIALAMIGAVKKYRVIITVSEKISKEKKSAIRSYGAKLVVCPVVERYDDPRGCWTVAKRLAREIPHAFMPDQHFNLANADAHYRSTGPEIWRQTRGKITHFFAAAGTAGTISGCGKYLKEKNPNVKVFGVDATNSYFSTKGNPKPYQIEGMGIDHDSPILNLEVIDKIIPVTDRHALRMMNVMAERFGLLIGPSSGAVAYAVRQHARKLASNDLVVFIIADSGRAYFTKKYY